MSHKGTKLSSAFLYFISSCREEDGTLKVSEVKSGPLMKQDLDSSVS